MRVAYGRAPLGGIMHDQPDKPRLRLPDKLAFTAFRVAIAGTVACSGTIDSASTSLDATADALADAHVDARADGSLDGSTDAPDDAAGDDAVADAANDVANDDASDGSTGDACSGGETIFCGQAMPDASCPGAVCSLSQCPLDAGCEPFV